MRTVLLSRLLAVLILVALLIPAIACTRTVTKIVYVTVTPAPISCPTPSCPTFTPAPTPTHIPTLAPTSTPKPTPTPTPQQRNPVLIKEWSGTGITTTESFTINENPWSIKWQSNPIIMNGSSMGMLQVYVYQSNNLIALAANTGEATSGTSYVHYSGTFYLTINAANTDWDVQIWGVR